MPPGLAFPILFFEQIALFNMGIHVLLSKSRKSSVLSLCFSSCVRAGGKGCKPKTFASLHPSQRNKQHLQYRAVTCAIFSVQYHSFRLSIMVIREAAICQFVTVLKNPRINQKIRFCRCSLSYLFAYAVVP